MELNHTILLTGFLISTTLLVMVVVILIASRLKIKKLKQLNDKLHSGIESLKAANIELEDRFARMLKEFQHLNERLADTNKALERSKEEFASFSYSISHDLKAPTRAINGFCSILTEEYYEALDENGKKTVATIQKNAAHIDALISDLLELSRIGTVIPNRQKFDMSPLLEQVLHEKTNGASLPQVKISPMGEAYADAMLMRQVWGNLISNAIKFSSRQQTPVIEIGSSRTDNEQLYWIRDNGVGFDPVYKNKLFKVFSRLHTKKEFEGTGAGLAIVKKIVEAHGGRIWAEGELSKGAIFYFTLPVAN